MISPTLSDGISQIMTGNSDSGSKCLTKSTESFIGCKIDLNLTATQSVMGIMNSIDTADDPSLEEKVDRMRWFAGIGTAGPAIVAGTMLIVYRIAMALFIGFAPIFILCLLFKKTAPLFQKWLYYGLATVFSGVMLGVMSEIATDLITTITASSGALSLISSVLTGNGTTGIMQTVTQQLGLGLILSTLLIVVPPMAGMWFNGVMGNFSPYSAFNGWGGSGQALPPGLDGGSSYRQQVENRVSPQVAHLSKAQDTTHVRNTPDPNLTWANGSNISNISKDEIKPNSQLQQGMKARTLEHPLSSKAESKENK